MKKKGLLLITGILGITISLFLFLVLSSFLFLFFWNSKEKSNIMDIAEQKEYNITFENYFDFCITENDVKYYYRNILGRVKLLKIYTEVSCKGDYEVVDDIGKITISAVGKDTFEVSLSDQVLMINARGIETTFNESIRFVCSSEFTEESIDPNDIISIRGKANKYYNSITKDFISKEELCELYERSMEIEKEFH